MSLITSTDRKIPIYRILWVEIVLQALSGFEFFQVVSGAEDSSLFERAKI